MKKDNYDAFVKPAPPPPPKDYEAIAKAEKEAQLRELQNYEETEEMAYDDTKPNPLTETHPTEIVVHYTGPAEEHYLSLDHKNYFFSKEKNKNLCIMPYERAMGLINGIAPYEEAKDVKPEDVREIPIDITGFNQKPPAAIELTEGQVRTWLSDHPEFVAAYFPQATPES